MVAPWIGFGSLACIQPATRIVASFRTAPGASGAKRSTIADAVSPRAAAHGFNVVDYSPLTRAALVHLDRWIADGTQPPPSAHPRIADGTAVSRAKVLEHFAARGPVTLDPERLSRVRTIDLGPDAARGVGRYPSIEGAEYPAYVSAIDADGNELAGVRLPDISSPVATHTGWNPRHESNGAPGLASHFVGISHFWSPEKITRRYPTRDAYEQCVSADAQIARRVGPHPPRGQITGDQPTRWPATTPRCRRCDQGLPCGASQPRC